MRTFLRDAGAVAASVAAAGAALAAWAVPSTRGDLFLALAGGRDVLQGKLGRPDTWAFTSGGGVWVNPGWGSDAILALVHRALGDPGLLALKALLLVLCAVLVAAAARARGAGTRAGLLAAAVALAASPAGLPLRPALMALALAPAVLWTLFRSTTRSRWIWASPVLVWAWANLAPGALVGLVLLALWTLSEAAAWAVRRADGGRALRPGAATVAAFLLAAFANPFGPASLTLPLKVLRSPVWRQMAGWDPLLGGGLRPVPWIFGVLVLLVALPLVVRSVRDLAGRRFSGPALFDLLLTATALAMVFTARGLLPLAAFLLAPLLAGELRRILRSETRLVPVFAAATLLLAAVCLLDRGLPAYYAQDNPRYPRESLLERMAGERTRFPAGAATFLEANNVRCRVFHEPQWEGFLRWKTPRLELFVGRRGAGVYPDSLETAREAILSGPTPAEDLRRWDVPLAVIPLTADVGGFTKWLLLDPGATWAYIYCDRHFAVLADTSDPLGNSLVARASEGNLVYASPAVAALSRGMCLACPAVAADPAEAADALKAALKLEPFDFAYKLLIDRAVKAGAGRADVIRFLELQREALQARSVDAAEGLEIWKSREAVARLLLRNYDPKAQEVQRRLMLDALTRTGKAIRKLSSERDRFSAAG